MTTVSVGDKTISFPDGMSRDEIQDVVSTYVNAAVDVGATFASGAVAEPIAGLTALVTNDPDAVEGMMSRMTYQPQTEMGKRALNAIGDTMQTAVSAVGLDHMPGYWRDRVVPALQDQAGPVAGSVLAAGSLAALTGLMSMGGGSGRPRGFGRYQTGSVGSEHKIVSHTGAAVPVRRKTLNIPAVKRREDLRSGESTHMENNVERVIISPEEYLDKAVVPVVGDKSLTGAVFTDVNGVPLSQPVTVEGGPGYSQLFGGWASMSGAARSKQSNFQKAQAETDREVVGVYSGMANDAIDFSTPVVEMMLRQFPSLRPAKKAIESFDKIIKKDHPEFVGLDSQDIFRQLKGTGEFPQKGAGAMRKTVVKEMAKARWKDAGFPIYQDIQKAITEPELLSQSVGASGFSSFIARPDQPLSGNSRHATYDTAIPGKYLGGLEKSVPAEIMFPKTFEMLAQQTNKRGKLLPRDQQLGSLRSRHLWEVADQQWVDKVSSWLEVNRDKTGAAGAIALLSLMQDEEEI